MDNITVDNLSVSGLKVNLLKDNYPSIVVNRMYPREYQGDDKSSNHLVCVMLGSNDLRPYDDSLQRASALAQQLNQV